MQIQVLKLAKRVPFPSEPPYQTSVSETLKWHKTLVRKKDKLLRDVRKLPSLSLGRDSATWIAFRNMKPASIFSPWLVLDLSTAQKTPASSQLTCRFQLRCPAHSSGDLTDTPSNTLVHSCFRCPC